MSLNIGIEGTDSEAAAAAAAGIPAAAWGSGALTLSSAQRGAGMYICSLLIRQHRHIYLFSLTSSAERHYISMRICIRQHTTAYVSV